MPRRRRRHTRRRRTHGLTMKSMPVRTFKPLTTCKVLPIAAQPTNGYYSDTLKSAKYNMINNTWTQRTGGGLGYPWMLH